VGSALPVIIIGVMGHRDVDEAHIASAAQSIHDLLHELQEITCGRARLIAASALAAGADQLFAREALSHGLDVIVPLPMMREEYRSTLADPNAVAVFDTLARQAQCFYVADWKEAPPLRTDLPAADAPYRRLGDVLDSTCAVLVAVWDGTFTGAVGGTGDTVARRLARDRPPAPIFWIPVSRRSGSHTRGSTNSRPGFIGAGPVPGELSQVAAADVHRMLRRACDNADSPADDESLKALRTRMGRAADLTHWLLRSDSRSV